MMYLEVEAAVMGQRMSQVESFEVDTRYPSRFRTRLANLDDVRCQRIGAIPATCDVWRNREAIGDWPESNWGCMSSAMAAAGGVGCTVNGPDLTMRVLGAWSHRWNVLAVLSTQWRELVGTETRHVYLSVRPGL
jgi:hypothetical protein